MQKLYKEDFHKTKNLSDINKKNSLNINGKLFLALELEGLKLLKWQYLPSCDKP